uniref:Uncharacterized protein n=1 Tax=Cucumis melo TaxID=3656 RepID=A0A9I9CZ54_CUCME
MNLQKHRPQDQKDNKSKETVKPRPSGKTPTVKNHPSQRRVKQKGPQKAHSRYEKREERCRGSVENGGGAMELGLKLEKMEEKEEEVTSCVSFWESEGVEKNQLVQ